MIILDTDVISAFMREPADDTAVRWLDRQPRTSIWTTTVTVLEVRLGLEAMPAGRRKALLAEAFGRLMDEKLDRRIAPFDVFAAEEMARLMAARRRRGETRDLRDSMIAGIALARRAALATHNMRHFADAGIAVIDPWATSARPA